MYLFAKLVGWNVFLIFGIGNVELEAITDNDPSSDKVADATPDEITDPSPDIVQICNTKLLKDGETEESANILKWSYIDTEFNGPQCWGKLGYPTCDGNWQSPIFLDTSFNTSVDRKLPKISFLKYGKKIEGLILENTGTEVLLRYPESDTPKSEQPHVYRAGRYINCYIKEFRFHFGSGSSDGSEHNSSLDKGNGRAMEMQALHTCPYLSERNLTDVTILAVKFNAFPDSKNNTDFEPITKNLGQIRYAKTSVTLTEPIPILKFYPPYELRLNFIRYDGSLPFPPCSEGVIWTIFESYIEISTAQLKEFQKLYRTTEYDVNPQYLYGNLRPAQERNGRKITLGRLKK